MRRLIYIAIAIICVTVLSGASIVPPRGSSGGITYTTEEIASFAPGDYFYMTHPSVSLDNALDLSMSYEASASGSTISLDFSSADSWSINDANTSSVTWVDGGVNTGNFSAAKDATVLVGCGIRINSSNYLIAGITGDGTTADSVTLSGDPGGNYAIEWIRGLYVDTGNQRVQNFISGTDRPVAWYTIEYASSTPAGTWSDWNSFATTASASSGAEVKVAFQTATGGSWYYFNNSSSTWQTMDITSQTDWDSYGCVVADGNSQALEDDTGVAISDASFDLIDLSGASVLNVVAAIKPAAASTAYFGNPTQYDYDTSSTKESVPDPLGMMTDSIIIYRINATTLLVTYYEYAMSGTLTNFKVTVRS